MRSAASNPSPIRSTIASLRCRSTCTSGYCFRNSGRIGATCWSPNDIGTASRTSPRGLTDWARASLSAASPSARMGAARADELPPGIGQRQAPGGAVEQARAQPGLQPADSLGNRGLGKA